MGRTLHRQFDLLAWPEVNERRVAMIVAHRDRREAQRRLRLSPHGEIANRRGALERAVAESLRAERAYQLALEGAGG